MVSKSTDTRRFQNRGGMFNQVLEYMNASFWELLLPFSHLFQEPFRVLHERTRRTGYFLMSLIFKPFGVKYIFDHHDLAPELYSVKFPGNAGVVRRVLKFMEKRSCSAADAVILQTNHIKDTSSRATALNRKRCLLRNIGAGKDLWRGRNEEDQRPGLTSNCFTSVV